MAVYIKKKKKWEKEKYLPGYKKRKTKEEGKIDYIKKLKHMG